MHSPVAVFDFKCRSVLQRISSLNGDREIFSPDQSKVKGLSRAAGILEWRFRNTFYASAMGSFY